MYKVLDERLCSFHGGNAQWVVGERMECGEGPLEPCVNGIHLCRNARDLMEWLGPRICPVSGYSHSEYIDAGFKGVTRWAVIDEPIPHWGSREMLHFACDCVQYEIDNSYKADKDKLQAYIDIARAFADDPAEWVMEFTQVTSIVDLSWAIPATPFNVAERLAKEMPHCNWSIPLGTYIKALDDMADNLQTYIEGTNEWVLKRDKMLGECDEYSAESNT